MDAGYEPGRIHQLSQRTLEAIATLDGLASTDSAAAEAIRTIQLTRSNLEDHWMPALRDIERASCLAAEDDSTTCSRRSAIFAFSMISRRVSSSTVLLKW